jgi:hypothetical protein
VLKLVSLVTACAPTSAASGWAAVRSTPQSQSRETRLSPQEGPVQPPSPETADQASQEASAEVPINEEQVVITASRTEQSLLNAPATVSVISSQTIEVCGETRLVACDSQSSWFTLSFQAPAKFLSVLTPCVDSVAVSANVLTNITTTTRFAT